MTYPPLIEEELDELVLDSELLVIVHVTAKCCRVSPAAVREFRAAAREIQDQAAIYEVDADAERWLVSRLDLKAVPGIVVFRSGTEVSALIGFYSREELRKRLRSIICNRS